MDRIIIREKDNTSNVEELIFHMMLAMFLD